MVLRSLKLLDYLENCIEQFQNIFFEKVRHDATAECTQLIVEESKLAETNAAMSREKLEVSSNTYAPYSDLQNKTQNFTKVV